MSTGTPFRRPLAMMAAISALTMAHSGAALQSAIAALPAYESRGHGGKQPHRKVGTKANARAAAKMRNIRRRRAAMRG